MKKRITAVFLGCMVALSVYLKAPAEIITYAAKGEPEELYARSAVLMDADTGRILYSKDGQEKRAMASTTKIMTCIIALEQGNLESVVTASEKAARQPKVHLGVKKGETFYLKDLLFSLMLESHNDSAVMIAEHIAGSVEKFVALMNQKAKELECYNTYFVTPNGLDAKDDTDFHHTTAEELARIMKYCIKDSPRKEEFIKITGTSEYKFSDCTETKNYYCRNHNAFLNMMEGAFSGKTGFTGEAGYCYVGALKKDDKTLIVALLACGWPNNRNYKWKDTANLMKYGLDNFQKKNVWKELTLRNVSVLEGKDKQNLLQKNTEVKVQIKNPDPEWIMLLGKEDDIKVKANVKSVLRAPVEKGEKVGEINYYLNNEKIRTFDLIAEEKVEKISFSYFFATIIKVYFSFL